MFVRKMFLKVAYGSIAAVALTASVQAAPLNLQQVPLYLLSRADPNVLLNMSVETPMGGAAYADQSGNPAGCTGRVTVDGSGDIGTCYIPTVVYAGYFDPAKCYTYGSGTFTPAALASSTHTCSSQWSGNFLNWASMTAIDMFILTMTGGNRVTDSTSATIVRRARKQNNDSWFPRKVLKSTLNVAPSTVTPFSDGTIWIHNTDFGFNAGTTFASATSGTPDKGAFDVKVKVCDPAVQLEGNCVAYGSGASTYYKPEGLIQGNAQSKRFGVISYTFDNSAQRDGGVLRSNMKYVGPRLPDGTNNSAAEFGTDGLLINNPDGATGGLNSGVINYINKFSDPGYKSYDPISELFYEAIRYFKNLGPTPEYSSGLTTAQCGGFQVLNGTSWQDPIQYRCQKNFIIAINDANPWLDKKLPGTYFTSSTINGATGFAPFSLAENDYGQPSNPDASINVRELTNTVGALEGLNGVTWPITGSWISGALSGANESVGGGPGTWDNSCTTAKAVGLLGEVMGTCPYTPKQNSYYIAGLAYYANTTDLRSDFANERGIQNVKSFVIDTQEYNANPLDGPRNMLWLAGKYGGFDDKNNDSIPQTAEWDADNNGLPDNYVLATEPQKLIAGLSRAFDFINGQVSSAASASVNAGSISEQTRLYQAKFNSTDWSGQLLAYKVNADGSLGDVAWDAFKNIPAWDDREIITVNADGTGSAFTWDALDATRRTQLLGVSDDDTKARIKYLRGDDSREEQNVTGGSPLFRNRPKSPQRNVLGDIVSSSPVYVGKPPFIYQDASYVAFQKAQATRDKMVYVGANDGMLHAFDADTGVEKFAFIPGTVFRNLHELTRQNYSHQYYVDGSPTMGDVFYSSAWHTVLVGGLNNGGQGVYALDVTNPTIFSEANANSIFRWEFTDANDADLGFTHSRPAITRVRNGTGTRWVAVFGNGYNNTYNDTAAGGQQSTTGQAVLYIVDIRTGTLVRRIRTNRGTAQDPLLMSRPNGLATPALVDAEGDGTADFAYAGDLFGNLWKFDLTDADPTNWNSAYIIDGVKEPLFVAKDSTGKVQPITSRPMVGRGPNGKGFVVLFGTGKFLEGSDRNVATLTTQSFYGILDPNTLDPDEDRVLDRALELTEQRILEEKVFVVGGKSRPLRTTTANTVANRGWYMDLLSGSPGLPPPSGFKGEMQVTDSILRNGRVIFTTLIPTADPCAFGGTSWLMELDALSGARLPYTPFDVNDDKKFDPNDYVTDADGNRIPASGQQSDVGITPRPGILSGEGAEFKYQPGTSGNMQVIRENPGPSDVGRQSWRQLR